MDWTNKNVNPHKVVQIGDEVEVMVLDIDEERRRISLGLEAVQTESVGRVRRELQEGRQGLRSDQVDHGLRRVHRLARRHRRPRASLRPLVGRAGRRSRAQLQEGRGARDHRARDRSGARAHLARREAARQRSAVAVPRRSPEGQHRHGRRAGARREGGDHRARTAA